VNPRTFVSELLRLLQVNQCLIEHFWWSSTCLYRGDQIPKLRGENEAMFRAHNPFVSQNALILCMLAGALSSVVSGANVVNLPANPSPQQLTDAKTALAYGSVIEMTNVSPATYSGYFNIALPRPKSGVGTQLCVIAAHQGVNGVIHTYSGPATTSLTGTSDPRREARQPAPVACSAGLQTWINKESLLQAGTGGPAPEAWTELTVQTFTSTGTGGSLQETVGVYRCNSSNTQTDYYMITKQADILPDMQKCIEANSCKYFNSARYLSIATDIPDGTPGYSIQDHGPTQVNKSGTASFSVGGSISGSGPSFNAGYSQSWSQSNVTTTDLTNPITSSFAQWSDSFDTKFNYGNPPAALTKLWESDQAVIYNIPVGTSYFNVFINDSGTFTYDDGFEFKQYTVPVGAEILVSPPSLSVSPPFLRVFPGQTVSFDITALIPDGTGETLGWTIGNIPNTLNLSATTGFGPQTITFTVPSSATRGTLATFSINTTQASATPEVRLGGIQFPITVVDNSDIPPGVLITGGIDWAPAQAAIFSAELWNPATQISTAVGLMINARVYHTATPIPNDRVFVTGGLNDSLNLIGSTEIYTEATQTFSLGPNMQMPRYMHTATLLNDRTVLLTGGGDPNNNAIVTAEIYDPVANTTTAVGNMTVPRVLHTATLLQNGTVLLTGGASAVFSGAILSSAEIYNPTTKTFTATGSMAVALQNHAATLLSNGQVLIAGGDTPGGNNGFYAGAFLYTPSSGAFTNIPGGFSFSDNTALVGLPQSSALLINGGGMSIQGTSLWNPSINNFDNNGLQQERRDRPKATLLRNTNTPFDGRVVIAGGVEMNSGSTGGESVEVFNPSTNTSSRAGTMTTPRSGNTVTLMGGVPKGTSVVLTSSQNPSITGNTVTFTAAVGGTVGVPTGTVTFSDGTTTLGSPVPLINSSAQYAAANLSIGQHSVTASYSGDNFNGPSISPATPQTVNPVAVQAAFTGLTFPPAPIAPATPTVSLSGTISGLGPVYPSTSENVSIVIGGYGQSAQIGPNGTFQITNFPTANLAPGLYSINYSYPGDVGLTSAKDATTSLTVSKLSPQVNLASPAPITAGTTTINLSGTIAGTGSTPTGTVSVSIGPGSSPPSNSGPLNSSGGFQIAVPVAALQASATPYTITYSYGGDSTYAAAVNISTTLQVNSVSTTKVTSSANPSTLGNQVMFTAAVTSSLGTPTGTVTFMDGSTQLGQPASLSSGSAQMNVTSLNQGTHSITAVYSGAAGFATSTSPVVSQVVNVAVPANVGVTASSDSGVYGTSLLGHSVAFTATVNGKNGTPTGSVTFMDGTTTLQKVPLTGTSGSAQANYSTMALTLGVHNITAVYSGDSAYGSGTSDAWPQTVDAPSSFGGLSNINVPLGTQTVSVTGTLSGAGPTYPDGTINVIVQIGGAHGAAFPSATDGSFNVPVSISALAAGPYTISVVYAGGSKLFNARNQSTTLTIQIPTTTNVVSSALSSVYGQPVTLSATVSATTGTPTGSVFFYDGTTALGPGVVLSAGKASFQATALSIGMHSITAAYDGGNTNFTKSTSSPAITQTITAAMPSFSGLNTAPSITQGTTSITLSGTIAAGTVFPTGTVTVTISGQSGQGNIGSNGAFTATVNNLGSLIASGSPYAIVYTYAGTGNFASVNDASTHLTVTFSGLAVTMTKLTASVQQCVPGVPFTLFITVSSTAGTPSGQVVLSRKNPDGTSAQPLPQFLDQNGQWNPALNGTNDQLQVGVTTYTATYQGVQNFQSSSNQLQLTCAAQ
jgi:hypothetical protein